jgi:hypothetical protein
MLIALIAFGKPSSFCSLAEIKQGLGPPSFSSLGTMGWQIYPLAGKDPPPGEKLVVSFRSFLESVAQAAPGPTPLLVSILRNAPREGATGGIR